MDTPSDDNGSADMDLSDASSSNHGLEVVQRATSSKRKIDDPVADTAVVKRPKTDGSDHVSLLQLPDAVLQRIFMSLSPAMLFRCTRVCRRFAHILTQISGEPVRSTKKQFNRHNPEPAAQLVDSEIIWSHSRRHTYPFLPRPLNNFSERQMLCLLTQPICQCCEKPFSRVKAIDGLSSGPGSAGIRTVWPFRITVCGSCLLLLSITDVGLLRERSAMPSGALRRGLPYAFITKDLHVVSDRTARANVGVGITKIFLRRDVEELKASYAEAEALGAGAAEEWAKGLDDVGKQAMSDTYRWLRWEDSLSSETDIAAHLKELDTSTFAARPGKSMQSSFWNKSDIVTAPEPTPAQDVTHLPRSGIAPPPVTTPSYDRITPSSNAHLPVRPSRNPHEVQEIHRLRVADIQRRCMQLIPPIEPEVLKHIPAYHAALQITTPMNDMAWEQLRPRIEQDREIAEKLHYEKAQRIAILNAAVPSTNYDDMLAAEKAADREWEQRREPLRKQLGEIADNLINRKWLRGSMTQHSAPIFAAEVLTHTYRQYYIDCEANGVAAATSLVLDDLRWVFESKIKVLAEAHCRELFVCSECFTDGVCRWFAFEGLIQHYGAKHTSDFSQGNIVVHWQSALWPQDPPFLTDLSKVDHRRYPRRTSHGSHHTGARPRSRNGNAEEQSSHYDDTRYLHRAQTSLLSDLPMFSQAKPPDTPQNPVSDEVNLAKLSGDVVEVWDAMAGVNGLEDSMRVQTVLQVVKARYEQYFQTYLPIELLTKALATNPKLAALKLTNKLACRFCDPTWEGTSMPYYERLAKTMYSLPTLLNHFKLNHMSQLHDPSMWSNLVDLPDKEQVQALLKTPGMDDKKLFLVAEAFPGVFPVPLPRIGRKDGTADAAKAGEYDPRNPSLPAKRDEETNGPLDLSKFDTDTFRPPSPPKPAEITAPPNHGSFSISADTLAAISRLQSGQAAVTPETHAALDALRSYAPSVAQQAPPERLPSPYAAKASVPAPTPPAVIPDISAIIATLTQQRTPAAADGPIPAPQPSFAHHPLESAEHATTFTTHHQNHESFATPAPYQSFGAWQPPPLPAPLPTQPQYYTPAYQPARESFGGQDLLAALNQNRAASQHPDTGFYGQARAPSVQYARDTPSYQGAIPQYNFPQAPAPVQYARQPSYPPQYGHQGQPPQGDQPVMMTEVYQPDGSKYLVDPYGRRFYQAND
ncbi:hypothetical protein AMS68_003361 [Peltaster fructicola]|uniref:F-box domain-containing protein n=1 Tax=Peltaster fructicola TaxID=286661 RepID=A0A6H0XSY5_9PEZI|nr:hypothetical protein AMS68_003361 [Peltaster fructicola]